MNSITHGAVILNLKPEESISYEIGLIILLRLIKNTQALTQRIST
jgi:outer membrane receptor for ferrienterochelin and colicin